MAKIIVPEISPGPIPEKRFAVNGHGVTQAGLRRVAQAYNHVSVNQRKMVHMRGFHARSTPEPLSNDYTAEYFLFRTGENVEMIELDILMAPAITSSSDRAYVQLVLDDGTNPIMYSAEVIYAEVSIAALGGVYEIGDLTQRKGRLRVSDGLLPNTIYRGSIRQRWWARYHSCAIYEVASTAADTSNVAVVDPGDWESNKPVYYQSFEALAETGELLWQHNAQQLFSWSRHDTFSVTNVTATVLTNMFENQTSWTADAPGFVLNTEYHDTAMGDIPVTLCVYAVRTGGTGGLNVALLRSGGTIISRSIASTPTFIDTSTHTITATATPEKVDVLMSTTSGTTWQIISIGLFEYEA